VQRHPRERRIDAGRREPVVIADERSVRVAQRFQHAGHVGFAVGQIGPQRDVRVRGAVGIDERIDAAVDVAQVAADDVDGVRG
jgi:hypothetical protein